MTGDSCRHGEPRGPRYCALCRRWLAELRGDYVQAPTGEARRDAGQQIALTAADGDWKQTAREALRDLADSGRGFTSEDLTDRVGLPSGDVGANRNNAVGALMSWAVRSGLIVEVGQTRSTRRTSNAAKLSRYVGARHARQDGAA